MNFIQRFFARRKLKTVVNVMPIALQRMFGAKDEYSFGQVTRVLEKINAHKGTAPYAVAAFCAPEEFMRLEHSKVSRDQLRAELASLFHLSGPDFRVSELRARLRETGADVGYNDTNANSGSITPD
jgi:hypothetical protein